MTIRRLCTLFATLALCALALPTLAQSSLVRFTGQLLDVRNGYVYFSTGDAFQLAPDAKILDYDTGKPTTLQPHVKLYARAVLDPTTNQPTRVGRRLEDGKLVRYAKKSGTTIPEIKPTPGE